MLPYRGRTPADEAATDEEVRRFPTLLRRAALRSAVSTTLRAGIAGLAILVTLVVLFVATAAAPWLLYVVVAVEPALCGFAAVVTARDWLRQRQGRRPREPRSVLGSVPSSSAKSA